MSTYTFGHIIYTYGGSTASVTGFEVFLPGIVTANILSSFVVSSVTYSVTAIGSAAFQGCATLTSVTIPSSVTSIDSFAFDNCTALTSVSIPNSMTSIGVNAFGGCSALPSITLPNNASFTIISQATFSGCTSLTSITIPSFVTNIQNNAFSGCTGFTSITIPNSVTTFGQSVFLNCTNLTSFTLPTNASFTTIPQGMFRGCSKLPSVTITNFVTTIESDVFVDCTLLASIIFPNSVTSIGSGVFLNCTNLTSVTLPTNGLFTTIDVATFQNCSKLTSLTIPNSVTTIQDYAVVDCILLASLTIGNSVTSIGQQAFANCTSLSSVSIPSSVTSIGNYAFYGCSNLNVVYFLQTPTLPTPGTDAFSAIKTPNVGRYLATATNASTTIAPLFTSISTITPPTLTSMSPFTSIAPSSVVVILYANLVTNGNEVVSNTPYVFLVNAVSTGSLLIGATQGTATAWNASTNNTIAAGTNAYWTSPGSISGLLNAFSVVIQDSAGLVTSPNVDVLVSVPYPCFLEGTKLLCFENNQEVYREIENLRKGDLVKTIYNGYMPIYMMGTTALYNPGNDYRVANRLYKCPKENYPTLFEDLYITGCHSILVPELTDDQWENTKAVNGNIYVTDNHFRLIACADEKAEPFNKEGFMNIYHIALEHHDIYMNYGIYANGLLVESCSVDYLIKYSNLRIIGEDCSVSKNIHIDDGSVSNNMSRQLVATY